MKRKTRSYVELDEYASGGGVSGDKDDRRTGIAHITALNHNCIVNPQQLQLG